MPALKNPFHERFCQHRALNGESVGESHRLAGGGGAEKNHKRNGEKLTERKDVKARIAELLAERKEAALEGVKVTEKYIVKELLRNVDDARSGVNLFQGKVVKEDGAPVPKVDCNSVNDSLGKLGKHIGMWPNVTQLAISRGKKLEGLTLNELLDTIAANLHDAFEGSIELDKELLRDVLLGKRNLPGTLTGRDGESGGDRGAAAPAALPPARELPPV